jgi:polar amino acid transport system substrate-binding protein
MTRRSILVLLPVMLVAGPLLGLAQTLDDVMKSGVLKVAVPQDFPPFGSVGSDKPVGYDIDTAKRAEEPGGETEPSTFNTRTS